MDHGWIRKMGMGTALRQRSEPHAKACNFSYTVNAFPPSNLLFLATKPIHALCSQPWGFPTSGFPTTGLPTSGHPPLRPSELKGAHGPRGHGDCNGAFYPFICNDALHGLVWNPVLTERSARSFRDGPNPPGGWPLGGVLQCESHALVGSFRWFSFASCRPAQSRTKALPDRRRHS